MIINTEDQDDQEYYDELYGPEGQLLKQEVRDHVDLVGDEDDYYDEEEEEDMNDRDGSAMAALSYYQRHKMFPPMQRIPIEAEYMSNPSDVIDEEEFEES